MRDYKGALKWYRENQTTAEIGFNPDGMCQKIVRTARLIKAVYSTAKKSQDATPKEHRFYNVADLRKGMVLYFDDPNDSNTAGHVVTMIGRVRGFDPDSLHDVLVETNSVKSGEIVVVRADYFKEHWNDDFQFGATWLNGEVLDVFTRKPKTESPQDLIQKFRESRPEWDMEILTQAGTRLPEIKAVVKQIEKTILSLPDDEGDSRVKAFKTHALEDGKLNMSLLNEAIKDGRTGHVKDVRDQLRYLIKSVLPRS